MEIIKNVIEKEDYYDLYRCDSLMVMGGIDQVPSIEAKTFLRKARQISKNTIPKAVKVIFNYPATIVLWEDGTKTVVQVQDERFDEEKGFAMAFMKKVMGNTGKYFDEVKKWCEE